MLKRIFVLGIAIFGILLLLVWACDDINTGEDSDWDDPPAEGDDDAAADDDDATTDDDDDAAAPTWTDFAQGFMADYCTRCHSDPPSGAPFPLETYQQVTGQSAAVKNEVEGKSMPPSAPLPSDSEIAQLVAWIDAGAPE
jgi:hypothetical protein